MNTTDKLRDAAQLLPCPFCGGKPAIGNNRHTVTKEGHHIQEIVKWETWISCPHCQFAISSGCIDVASRGNAIAHQETLERATQMWNTRAPLAQQDAQAVPVNRTSEEDRKAALIQIGKAAIKAGWIGGELADFVEAKLAAAPTPSAQRVMLTDEEILDMAEGCTAQYHDLLEYARAVIEAYERKNEIK